MPNTETNETETTQPEAEQTLPETTQPEAEQTLPETTQPEAEQTLPETTQPEAEAESSKVEANTESTESEVESSEPTEPAPSENEIPKVEPPSAGVTSFSKEELEKLLNEEMIEFLKGSPEFVTQVHQTLLLTQEVYNAHLLLVGKFQDALDFSHANNEALAATKASFEHKYENFLTRSAEVLALCVKIEEIKDELAAADIAALKKELEERLKLLEAHEFLQAFEDLKEKVQEDLHQSAENLKESQKAQEQTNLEILAHQERIKELQAEFEQAKQTFFSRALEAQEELKARVNEAQEMEATSLALKKELDALNLKALRAELTEGLDALKSEMILNAFKNLQNEFVLLKSLIPNELSSEEVPDVLGIKEQQLEEISKEVQEKADNLKDAKQVQKDLENDIAILEEALRGELSTEEREQKESQLAEKNAALQATLRAIETLEEEQSNLEEALANKQKEILDYKALQDAQAEELLAFKRNEITLLTAELRDTSDPQDRAQLSAQISELQREINALSAQQDFKHHSEDFKSAATRIGELQDLIQKKSLSARELETEVRIATEQIESATTDAQRTWLESYKDTTQAQLTTLLNELQSLQSQLESAQSDLERAHEGGKRAIREELAAKRAERDAQKEALNTTCATISSLENSLTLLREQAKSASGAQKEALQREILDKEAQLRELKNTQSLQQKELKATECALKELEITLSLKEQEERQKALEFQAQSLEWEISELEKDIAKETNAEKRATLEAQKAAKEEELERNTQSLQTLQTEREELLKSLEEQKEANARTLESEEFATKGLVWERADALQTQITTNQNALQTQITTNQNALQTQITTNQNALQSAAQTLGGVKTFTNGIALPALSTHNPVPTANNHIANKLFVENLGGIKNLGNSATANANFGIDFRNGNHFVVNMTAKSYLSVTNWGFAGKSGTITVNTAANLLGFRAPFVFRVAQSGFTGTEIFSYFCYSASLIRLVRT